jgi:hypothetical protein
MTRNVTRYPALMNFKLGRITMSGMGCGPIVPRWN